MKIHTNDRKHKCTHCERAFIDASGLKTHMRLHTGERPYSCQGCNKSFRDASNMARHAKGCLNPSKSFNTEEGSLYNLLNKPSGVKGKHKNWKLHLQKHNVASPEETVNKGSSDSNKPNECMAKLPQPIMYPSQISESLYFPYTPNFLMLS